MVNFRFCVAEGRDVATQDGIPVRAPHCLIYLDGQLKHITGGPVPFAFTNNNPQWRTSQIVFSSESFQTMLIQLWDWQYFDSSDLLGEVTIPKSWFEVGPQRDNFFDLELNQELTRISLRVQTWQNDLTLPPPTLEKTSLDTLITQSEVNPEASAGRSVPFLLQLLCNPQELNRKDKILVALRNFSKECKSRITLGENKELMSCIFKLLDRTVDIVVEAAQRLLMAIVREDPRDKAMLSPDLVLRLNELRRTVVVSGKEILSKELKRPKTDTRYIRIVEIIRCCSLVDCLRDELYESGFAFLLLEALGRCNDKNQTILISTLLVFASSDFLRKKLMAEALFALNKFVQFKGIEVEMANEEIVEPAIQDAQDPVDQPNQKPLEPVVQQPETLERRSKVIVQARAVPVLNAVDIESAFSHASEFLDEETKEIDRALQFDLKKSVRSSQLIADLVQSMKELEEMDESLSNLDYSTPPATPNNNYFPDRPVAATILADPPRRPSGVPPSRPATGPAPGVPPPNRPISSSADPPKMGRNKSSIFSMSSTANPMKRDSGKGKDALKRSLSKDEKKSGISINPNRDTPSRPEQRPEEQRSKITRQLSNGGNGAPPINRTTIPEQPVNRPEPDLTKNRSLPAGNINIRKPVTAIPPRPGNEPRAPQQRQEEYNDYNNYSNEYEYQYETEEELPAYTQTMNQLNDEFQANFLLGDAFNNLFQDYSEGSVNDLDTTFNNLFQDYSEASGILPPSEYPSEYSYESEQPSYSPSKSNEAFQAEYQSEYASDYGMQYYNGDQYYEEFPSEIAANEATHQNNGYSTQNNQYYSNYNGSNSNGNVPQQTPLSPRSASMGRITPLSPRGEVKPKPNTSSPRQPVNSPTVVTRLMPIQSPGGGSNFQNNTTQPLQPNPTSGGLTNSYSSNQPYNNQNNLFNPQATSSFGSSTLPTNQNNLNRSQNTFQSSTFSSQNTTPQHQNTFGSSTLPNNQQPGPVVTSVPNNQRIFIPTNNGPVPNNNGLNSPRFKPNNVNPQFSGPGGKLQFNSNPNPLSMSAGHNPRYPQNTQPPAAQNPLAQSSPNNYSAGQFQTQQNNVGAGQQFQSNPNGVANHNLGSGFQSVTPQRPATVVADQPRPGPQRPAATIVPSAIEREPFRKGGPQKTTSVSQLSFQSFEENPNAPTEDSLAFSPIRPELLKDVANAVEFNDIQPITDLLLALEGAGPPCLKDFLKHLKSHVLLIPRKDHYFWNQKNANHPHPLHLPRTHEVDVQSGVSEILLLSTIFSGVATPELIDSMSDNQLYFYLSIILNYNGRNQQQILIETSKRLSTSRACGLNLVFLQGNVDNGPIASARVPLKLSSTVQWLSQTLVLGSGKNKLKEGSSWEGLDLLDPVCFLEEAVTSIRLEKIFSSATKPLLLRLNPHSSNTTRIIFKRGDDLQQDHGVQSMFYLFNRLWQQSDLKYHPFIHQYKIVPMGPKIGVMEFVEGCIPSGKFDWAKNLPAGEAHSEIRRMKFLCSMAGSYVACWILGIRDRHQDNMMIKDGHIFFHIDFGFIFNDAPGFDAPIFSIPRGVKANLSPREWGLFVSLCGEAFLVLHENAGMIMNVCTSIFGDLPNVSVTQIRKFLVSSLMINDSPQSAVKKIYALVEEGSSSTQKEIKYLMHDWAQKIAK